MFPQGFPFSSRRNEPLLGEFWELLLYYQARTRSINLKASVLPPIQAYSSSPLLTRPADRRDWPRGNQTVAFCSLLLYLFEERFAITHNPGGWLCPEGSEKMSRYFNVF